MWRCPRKKLNASRPWHRRNAWKAAAPIVIEDDVFVGVGALVMKGVPICGGPIGGGAVVGAGSVRTQDVPRAVGAGNPAMVMREL